MSIWYRVDPERSYPGDDFIIAETWEWRVYLRDSWNIERDATVVDIGAHIGAFSLFAASKAHEGTVYAYEPFPENYHLLVRNLQVNDMSNVIARRRAVSGSRGVCRLYLDPKSESGHSLLKTTDSWIDVSTLTLTDLFEYHSIAECDFLKLDCEGAEKDILLETPDPVLQRVRRIALEYHVKILGERSLRTILRRLDSAGFEVISYCEAKPFLPILLEREE